MVDRQCGEIKPRIQGGLLGWPCYAAISLAVFDRSSNAGGAGRDSRGHPPTACLAPDILMSPKRADFRSVKQNVCRCWKKPSRAENNTPRARVATFSPRCAHSARGNRHVFAWRVNFQDRRPDSATQGRGVLELSWDHVCRRGVKISTTSPAKWRNRRGKHPEPPNATSRTSEREIKKRRVAQQIAICRGGKFSSPEIIDDREQS